MTLWAAQGSFISTVVVKCDFRRPSLRSTVLSITDFPVCLNNKLPLLDVFIGIYLWAFGDPWVFKNLLIPIEWEMKGFSSVVLIHVIDKAERLAEKIVVLNVQTERKSLSPWYLSLDFYWDKSISVESSQNSVSSQSVVSQ